MQFTTHHVFPLQIVHSARVATHAAYPNRTFAFLNTHSNEICTAQIVQIESNFHFEILAKLEDKCIVAVLPSDGGFFCTYTSQYEAAMGILYFEMKTKSMRIICM